MTKQEFELQKAKAISEALKNTVQALIKSVTDGGKEASIRNILIYQMGISELLKITAQPYNENTL